MEGTVVKSLRKKFFHMCLLVVQMTSVLFCLELDTSQEQCVVHSDRVLFCLELDTS